MFEDVESKKETKTSPRPENSSPKQKKTESSSTDNGDPSSASKKSEVSSGKGKDADSGNGGEVEDIFEGIETGEPASSAKNNTGEKTKKTAPSFSGVNSGLIKFVTAVTVAAAVILFGAYWISEWMVNSL